MYTSRELNQINGLILSTTKLTQEDRLSSCLFLSLLIHTFNDQEQLFLEGSEVEEVLHSHWMIPSHSTSSWTKMVMRRGNSISMTDTLSTIAEDNFFSPALSFLMATLGTREYFLRRKQLQKLICALIPIFI